MDPLTIGLIAGCAIFALSVLMQNWKYRRQEDERLAQERAEAKALREAEQKRQRQLPEPAKSKTSNSSVRVPPPDTQAEMAAFRSGVRQESEIRQAGQQVLAQIEAKTLNLQALTREADQTAQRLQQMIDQFEQLVRAHAVRNEPAAKPLRPVVQSPRSNVVSQESQLPPVRNVAPERDGIAGADPLFQTDEFSGVLGELESELNQFRDEISRSSFVDSGISATNSRGGNLRTESVAAPHVEIRRAPKQDDPFANSSPKMPGSIIDPIATVPQHAPIVIPTVAASGTGHRITATPKKPSSPQPIALPIDALYENEQIKVS